MADRGALLSAIHGGAKLKKVQTVDKSSVKGAGAVVGNDVEPRLLAQDFAQAYRALGGDVFF